MRSLLMLSFALASAFTLVGCAAKTPTPAPETAVAPVAEEAPSRGEVVLDEDGKPYLRLNVNERLCDKCDR